MLRKITLLALIFGMSSLFTLFWTGGLSNLSSLAHLRAFGNSQQIALAQADSVKPVDTTIDVSPVLTNTIYLPLVTRNPEGLYGYVTENGLPVSDLELTLYTANNGTLQEFRVMTTTTEENGLYQFMNVPGIQILCGNRYCYNSYFVNFENANHDPQRIDWWSTNGLYTYTQGTNILLGSFDIGRPELIAPIDGDVVTSTNHFRWTPRNIVGDNYAVQIIKANGAFGYNADFLGSVGEYSLDIINEVCPVVWSYPCSDWYGDPFNWYLIIGNNMGVGRVLQPGTFIIQP
jgi:hypothetical protein